MASTTPTPCNKQGEGSDDDHEKWLVQDNGRGSDVDSFSEDEGLYWTSEEEQAVVRKFDRRLVLFMALLYLLSFLDRSNIGNARIAGMESDLHLSSRNFDWLLTAFYITYILFEWMTLLYKLFPPHVYISACVFAWGFLASLQSVAGSFGWMLVIRLLLGVAEAAFGPGVPFFLSFFYKRDELAYRVGLFIAAAPLATSFASSLAWLIVRLSRGGQLAPWRALFLVEGFPSIVVAFIAYYYIPDSPSDASYLTVRERQIATRRLQPETVASAPSSPTELTKPNRSSTHRISFKEFIRTLTDPPSYLTALMFLSANVSFSSLPVFLPTIIHTMGFTSLSSQLLSAPPYLLSFLFVLLVSHLSDRLHTRSGLLIPVALLSASSYALNAFAGYNHHSLGHRTTIILRYLSVYGAASGFFASITLIITWTLNNNHTQTGRGTGMAILNIIGQTGPLIGTRLYPKSDGPFYIRGMTICATFMVGVAILAFILRVVLAKRNRTSVLGPAGKRDGMIGRRTGKDREIDEREDAGEEMELREGLIFGDDEDRWRSRGERWERDDDDEGAFGNEVKYIL